MRGMPAGPILVIIGILIFMESILEINWCVRQQWHALGPLRCARRCLRMHDVMVILMVTWRNAASRLDLTEAAPAFMTIIGMPFTSNIAYGFIGGFMTWFVTKFFTYQVLV